MFYRLFSSLTVTLWLLFWFAQVYLTAAVFMDAFAAQERIRETVRNAYKRELDVEPIETKHGCRQGCNDNTECVNCGEAIRDNLIWLPYFVPILLALFAELILIALCIIAAIGKYKCVLTLYFLSDDVEQANSLPPPYHATQQELLPLTAKEIDEKCSKKLEYEKKLPVLISITCVNM